MQHVAEIIVIISFPGREWLFDIFLYSWIKFNYLRALKKFSIHNMNEVEKKLIHRVAGDVKPSIADLINCFQQIEALKSSKAEII